MILAPDADMKVTLPAILKGGFYHAGHVFIPGFAITIPHLAPALCSAKYFASFRASFNQLLFEVVLLQPEVTTNTTTIRQRIAVSFLI